MSVGGTLDGDGDAVMEEAVAGKGGDVIELTDAESEEESEESELSERAAITHAT
jgi:hypothetical protein